jgi:hypothetical protein
VIFLDSLFKKAIFFSKKLLTENKFNTISFHVLNAYPTGATK